MGQGFAVAFALAKAPQKISEWLANKRIKVLESPNQSLIEMLKWELKRSGCKPKKPQ